MDNCWSTLPTGFIGLSPMDGVTDHPCRFIQKKYGKHALTYTEFTCVEGITHGATRLLKDFLFDETQRPILAQIYGHTPADFRTVALIVCQLGFDGVDINMGCPAKNVTHLGSGAALIRTPQLAQEIIKNVQDGVEDWFNGKTVDDTQLSDEIKAEINKRSAGHILKDRQRLPVSVKTRIGFEKPVIKEWISTLLEMNLAAIALHGRTLNQRYAGLADWDEIGKAAELVHQTPTLIMGNGDIKNVPEAREKIAKYGLDGVLIGRATWGNPWIFQEHEATVAERFAVAIEHAQLYEQTFQDTERYNFLPMRKHIAWYLSNFPGAAEVRMKAMRTNSSEELKEMLVAV
ncbi:MAG: tRNA-dihydrouridine synthase [Patescibacteria group bacterium]